MNKGCLLPKEEKNIMEMPIDWYIWSFLGPIVGFRHPIYNYDGLSKMIGGGYHVDQTFNVAHFGLKSEFFMPKCKMH